jgi:Protein of unknown function (DUF3237)
MDNLKHRHLLTLTLDVDFSGMATIGATAAGVRRIAPVTGGTFTGERLRGTVLPGADWVIVRPDGVLLIDVRLTLETDDDALIYLTYQGRFRATPADMVRFAKGEQLAPDAYSLATVAKFECGSDRHAWLNDTIAVGTGTQTRAGPVYEIFEIG